MEKIIHPGRTIDGNVFVKITYEKKDKGLCLSLSGVVGPTRDGNAKGSSGQMLGSLLELTEYVEDWDAEKVQKLYDAWQAWHLNDMNAACAHQAGPDWDASRKINLIGFKRTKEADRLTSAASEGTLSGRAYNKAKKILHLLEKWYGESVNADAIPIEVSSLIASGYLEPWHWDYIEKTETAGWTEEKLGGILSKPCPICGYRYGTAWLFREVPKEVIDFLFTLPESDLVPAWV